MTNRHLHGAPPAPSVPSGTTSKSQQTLEVDPYNLNSSGTGILSTVPLQGVWEFFGLSPNQIGQSFLGDQVLPGRPRAPLTAEETLAKFVHLSGIQLANIQQQMWKAGLYSASYQPILGQLHPEDINAFRSLIIGLASNPSQANLTDYLAQAAQAGQQNVGRTRSPLVIKLKSENDIRGILQAGAQQLFGKFVDESDINKFIAAYHNQEAGFQTAAYQATGFNPETGQQDLSGTGQSTAQGTTLTNPDTEQGMNVAFSRQFYADHPVTAEMAQFVNAFDDLRQTLTASAPGGAHI